MEFKITGILFVARRLFSKKGKSSVGCLLHPPFKQRVKIAMNYFVLGQTLYIFES